MADNDRLLACAQKNQPELITALVASGCPPTHSNRVGQTAFHIAALWGNTNALSALISALSTTDTPVAATLNTKNNISGATPLHCAANSNKDVAGRLECIKVLMENGADPNVEDSYGNKPADYTDLPEFRELLGGDSLALHDALRSYISSLSSPTSSFPDFPDFLSSFSTLCTSIASTDPSLLSSSDSKNITPMMLAVTLPNADDAASLCELLTSSAASSTDDDNKTVLHHAVITHATNSDSTPHTDGRVALLKLLITFDLDPSAQDNTEFDGMSAGPTPHYSPLHYAISAGDYHLTDVLLQAHSNPTAADEELETPLHLCFFAHSRSPRLDLASLLLVNQSNKSRILDMGCKRLGMTSPTTLDHNTLLHEYAKKGNVEVTSFLLENGANVNAIGRQGMTPLHHAARGCKVEVVKALLAKGADRTVACSGGKTAKDYAAAQGDRGSEVVEVLDAV
jgi:ankyrin repeat protein